MTNHFLIMIDDSNYKLNDIDRGMMFVNSKPEGMGGYSLAYFPSIGKEIIVRLLKSDGHVENATYLVDLKNKECWPFDVSF